ncbi:MULTISPECIES: hypothetical protein [Sinorhizobium]|uniref:hypothetical protein n=1 Tax=Sinorhizobium TaxID=28105 RepID=UPI0011D1FF10|nr:MULTISPECIES: hypothetical protein [Sinorhizobium]WOS66987.1 hypothetical protein SFGR64A_31820 [Sinorhizobium fredii GR64]
MPMLSVVIAHDENVLNSDDVCTPVVLLPLPRAAESSLVSSQKSFSGSVVAYRHAEALELSPDVLQAQAVSLEPLALRYPERQGVESALLVQFQHRASSEARQK